MSIFTRIKLIDLDEEYLETVLNWRNQDHIRTMMFQDQVITLENHLKWFNRMKQDETTIVKIFLIDETPVGVVNFTNIDRLHSRCEWGFYIGSQAAPKGSGTLMGFAALHYLFEELKLRKLCAEVLGFNEKSIHFHNRLGFSKEGVLKEHFLRNQKLVDVHLFAIFQSTWEEQKYILKKKIKDWFDE